MTRSRLIRLLVLVAILVFVVALPVLAQTDPAPAEEGPSTADVVGALTVFGLIVKAGLAILRRHLPDLDGTLVQLAGWALGIGIAATLDYRAAAALLEIHNLAGVVGRLPVPVVDYIVTGFGIMAASGVIAEFVGTAGPKKAALQAQAQIVEVDATGTPV